jgi:hypothetical protein
MPIVIFIMMLIAGAIVYFKFSADSSEVKSRSKGKNGEQRQALRYFFNDGRLQKKVGDEAYDALVKAQVKGFDAKAEAIAQTGLDESKLNAIEPVCFEGYCFDGETYSKTGKDGKRRSPAYRVAWLFFTSTRVYLYRYTFKMDEDGGEELVRAYFYREVTHVSAFSGKKTLLKNVDEIGLFLLFPEINAIAQWSGTDLPDAPDGDEE